MIETQQFQLHISRMSTVQLDPRLIYEYDTHRNIPWNIVEYQPLRQYQDPQQSITQRRVKQGSATYFKNPTKKGSYMEQHIKNVKDLPPPDKYNTKSEFDQTLNIKGSHKIKIDLNLRKNSYLQQIQRKAKLHKAPGVGQYHLQEKANTASKKKSEKSSSRRFFYEDSEFLSTAVPGSGVYYPHDQIYVAKQSRKTYKDWIKKHQDESSRDRKRSLKTADPGTYRPLSLSVNTFDSMKLVDEKIKKKLGNKKALHGFGSSDSKFIYERAKKGNLQSRPDPCNYNTMIEWKGKGSDVKKNNWVRCLSAGPRSNIYH